MDSHETSKDALSSSLQYSGYAYLLADAALFAYGVSKREYGSAMTGLTWGLGGLAAAIYGKQSPEYQLKRLTQDLGHYLQQNGYTLPAHSELSRQTLRSHRIPEAIERFLYDHPSQILNTVYGLGSVGLIRSGAAKGDQWQKASGLLVASGALAGLLIPEKELPQHKEPATLLDNPIGWVSEKPLRVSGALYTLNNVALAKSGFDEMRAAPANKAYLLKYLAVASYVVANKLLADSNKDRSQTEGDLPTDALEALCAEVIAAQPKETQQAMMQEIVAFLSQQPNIQQSPEQLRATLTQKLDALNGNTKVDVAAHEGRLDDSRISAMSKG